MGFSFRTRATMCFTRPAASSVNPGTNWSVAAYGSVRQTGSGLGNRQNAKVTSKKIVTVQYSSALEATKYVSEGFTPTSKVKKV